MQIGAHVSASGGIHTAIDRAEQIEAVVDQLLGADRAFDFDAVDDRTDTRQ